MTWRSENPNIVKVSSDGTLTAVGKGTTRVWAECGNVKNYCTVEIPDVDMSWYIYSTWKDIEYATYNKLGPWAGTYMDSQGNMSAVVIFYHEYQSVGAGVQNRFYQVAYNLDTGKAIKQPGDYYEKQAEKYWGANKLAYMELVSEYLGLEVSSYNGTGFPMYYEKYDDLWVLK